MASWRTFATTTDLPRFAAPRAAHGSAARRERARESVRDRAPRRRLDRDRHRLRRRLDARQPAGLGGRAARRGRPRAVGGARRAPRGAAASSSASPTRASSARAARPTSSSSTATPSRTRPRCGASGTSPGRADREPPRLIRPVPGPIRPVGGRARASSSVHRGCGRSWRRSGGARRWVRRRAAGHYLVIGRRCGGHRSDRKETPTMFAQTPVLRRRRRRRLPRTAPRARRAARHARGRRERRVRLTEPPSPLPSANPARPAGFVRSPSRSAGRGRQREVQGLARREDAGRHVGRELGERGLEVVARVLERLRRQAAHPAG